MSARSQAGTASRPRSSRTVEAAVGQASRVAGPRLALLAAVCALTALGLVMVFSASAVTGLTEEGSAQGQFMSQLVFIAVGAVLALAVAKLFDYQLLVDLSPWLVMGSLLVLAFTRFAGVHVNGATRWLQLGPVSVQPSEFAKICIVLCIVHVFHRIPKRDRHLQDPEFIGFSLLCLAAIGLIWLQPDKGTVFVLAMALWVILVSDGYDRRTLLIVAAIFMAVYVAYAMSEDYSRRRVLALLDPFADESDTGYQLAHGFFAFASGGLFGRGLGMGLQKYAYLPEAHNDFILPVIGEELGLVGVVFVFACFGVIAWAGLRIAQEANDEQGRYLAMGCVGLLVGQAALNFAGVLGVAPMTGKAVPFVSAGGSSMLSSLAIVGLLCNISLRTSPMSAGDRRRAGLRLAEEGRVERVRPPRPSTAYGFRLIPGGAQGAPAAKAPLTRRELREVPEYRGAPYGRGASGRSPYSRSASGRAPYGRTASGRAWQSSADIPSYRLPRRHDNVDYGRDRGRRVAGGR